MTVTASWVDDEEQCTRRVQWHMTEGKMPVVCNDTRRDFGVPRKGIECGD